ncbi:MAG: glycosyltransferase [Campylobacterales bacterium]|nr:glycosyltransferase [Campylobacterales bacterium]
MIELDKNYSTTRRVIKADPQEIAGLVKQSNKPEDKFETVLFLSEGENRQGEGGLRTLGYFKVGGLITENDVCHSERSEESLKADSHPEQSERSPHPSPLTSNSSQADKPLITVVTVVFNGEKFLEETILSVINQTYDNVEYIIIDGGSTDGTLDIIKKYEHAIDYWVSEKDKGIYDAMNKGIDLATGEWINFMNGGDTFYDIEVISCISSLKVFTDTDLIFGDVKSTYKGFTKIHPARDLKNIYKSMVFSHQSAFIRSLTHKKFKYDLEYKLSADYNAIIQIYHSVYDFGSNFVKTNNVIAIVETNGVSQRYILRSVYEHYKAVRSLKADKLSIKAYYIKALLIQFLKLMVPSSILNIYRRVKFGIK